LYGSEVAHEFNETRQKLIQATSDLMDLHAIEDLSAAMVLERAGASKSSMYHFFEDFGDLLDETYVVRFGASVRVSIDVINKIVENSSTKEEFFLALEHLTASTQARENASLRFRRARKLARSERNEKFKKSLGELQQQLTDSLTLAFEQAQEKGFLNKSFEARTGAVFIQAYTLGRIVDDITTTHMNDADWEKLIGRIAREVLG
jgi:AcrR family transcriptional regulator